MALTVRPYAFEDRGAVDWILLACGYEPVKPEALETGEHFVVERAGMVIGYGHAEHGAFPAGESFLRCFAVDPQYHGTGTYIRAQRAVEAWGRAKGIRRFVSYVPPGHDQFRAYLTERCGYRPYHEAEGTTFLVKELQEV